MLWSQFNHDLIIPLDLAYDGMTVVSRSFERDLFCHNSFLDHYIFIYSHTTSVCKYMPLGTTYLQTSTTCRSFLDVDPDQVFDLIFISIA